VRVALRRMRRIRTAFKGSVLHKLNCV
jgi:CHAD domain-containing protein